MKITLKIKRYNPDADSAPYFQEYQVEVEPRERLLDALMQVKRFQDGSLGFRKSCAHGVCGSDAMRINGKDGLACKTLVREIADKDGDVIVVEPLRHMKVQRDLIVDQSEFFDKYRSVKPFMINDEPVEEKERIQSPEERLQFDDTTNCILCASCYSACPIPEEQPGFIGTAAIAHAFQLLADSRDRGAEPRFPVLASPDGVDLCQNHFECTKACPRSIMITKRINQTKRMLKDAKDG